MAFGRSRGAPNSPQPYSQNENPKGLEQDGVWSLGFQLDCARSPHRLTTLQRECRRRPLRFGFHKFSRAAYVARPLVFGLAHAAQAGIT